MKYEGQFISCSNDLRKYLDMPFEDNIEFNAISTDTRSIEKAHCLLQLMAQILMAITILMKRLIKVL